MTPAPPDAEAVARAERELDAAAVALAKGANTTLADTDRYVTARIAYRIAVAEAVERRVRADADAEIADLREYLGRQNDEAIDAMDRGVKVRLALGLSPTCEIDTVIAEAKRLRAAREGQ